MQDVGAKPQCSTQTLSWRSSLRGCEQSAVLPRACRFHPAPPRHDRVGRWRVTIPFCTLTTEYDTVPSAPRRTGREPFNSSGSPVMHHSRTLVFEWVFMLDVHVAGTTDYQGFASAGCHRLDPGWLFWSSISLEVFQRSDMVDLNICV